MKYPLVNSYFLALMTLILAPLMGAQASAASIPHGTVDLVAENQWIAPGHQTYFGFKFQLEKAWHIYWINPGDSGEPPRVEWHLPAGLSAGEIEWPAPRRLRTSTIVDFGYDDSVTLLAAVRASSALPTNQPGEIGAELKVLVCREICIPGKAQVSLTLPIKAMPPEPEARVSELFATARKSLPKRPPTGWTFKVSDEKDSFVLIANLGRETVQATFFPLEESQIDNSAPQKIVPSHSGFRLTLHKSDQLLKPIKRLRGVLEFSVNQAYIIDVAVENAVIAGQ